MGLAVVLLVYLVVLSTAAVVAGVVLAAFTRWYLRDYPAGRAMAVKRSALFPAACVIFAGAWFIAYATINDVVFHKDPMLGDGWYTNLGNGYAIDMIDVTDHGTVHPTGGLDNGLNDPAGVSGVRRLQVAGTHIFGTEDRNIITDFTSDQVNEDAFFAINTSTHLKREFPSERDLTEYARGLGTNLKLQPIEVVYRQYRNGWFDLVAVLILLAVPALGFCWQISYVVLRKKDTLPLTASSNRP